MLDDFRDEEEDLDKNGEFLDEFRQRLNSQSVENLEERKNEISRSQNVFIGTILGVGLAGIVSWFILASDYTQTEDVDIPIVRRPQTAIKVQPADPGGMEILNQDKTVYDIVEKKETDDIKVENLLPPPEEPKMPEDIIPTETQPAPEKEIKIDIIETAEKIINNNEVKAPAQPKKEPIKPEAKPVVVEEKPVQQPKPVVVEAPKPVEIAAGSWQIQLISSPNKSAMEKAWKDMSKKYSALNGLPHEIESADLGSKGTFYRLKAGSFKDRAPADKICNSIKSAGGSCLVKKK